MIDHLKAKTVALLRWSEQYTKTDMVYLAKGGGWLTFGQGFQILAGTGLAIAFANLLPQETYGTYKYVISAAGIIGAFTLSGMGTAVTQAVARGYEGALREGFKETLKWSLGIVVVGLGAAGYYYLQGNMTLSVAMLMIAVSYPILKSTELYQYFLDGKKNFKARSAYLAIWEAVEVSALVGTLFLTDNVLIILAVFFATNALPPLFFYFRTLERFEPKDETDPETSTYGKHLSVMQIIAVIAKHIDKVLVWHFLGPAALAIYAFAILPIQKLQSGRSIIGTLALPKFSDTDIPTLKKTLPKKALIFFLVCLAVVIIFILGAPYLYELAFPQYLESVKYAQVFSLSVLFLPAILFGKTLIAHGKTTELYISNIGANLLKIILLLTLLPIYGIWGAIFVLLGESILRFFFSAGFFYNLKT